MTGPEILSLLKDVGGYGLAALFAWLWIQERNRNAALQDARLVDIKDFGLKVVSAIDNTAHALDKLTETVKAKP